MLARWHSLLKGASLAMMLAGLMPATQALGEETGKTVEILAVDFPPYEFENPENGLRGFDVEVVEAAFERVGHQAVVTFLPWKRAKKLVADGTAPGLLTCGYRPERETDFAFSSPISGASRGFYTAPGFKGGELADFTDAKGHKVGVVLGYTTEAKMKELNIPYDASTTDVAALMKLNTGRIDMFLTVRENADYLGRQLPFINTLKFHVIKRVDYYLCVSRNWPDYRLLIENFNRGLRLIRSDGTYMSIHSRYRAVGGSS